MAKCIHDYEPSHRCPICDKERRHDQHGSMWEGEVGTALKGKKVDSINYDAEDDAKKREAENHEELMKDFVLNSFGTKLEEKLEKPEESKDDE